MCCFKQKTAYELMRGDWSSDVCSSDLFILISSGAILFETSNIIRGGETNYIRATVSLYVSLYNIFVSLLSILGFASRD